MCYNESVSWQTLIIGTILTILNLIYFRSNYEILIITLYWFGAVLMQLWEALIYRYKDNDRLCKTFSIIAAINTIIQPLVLLFLALNIKLLLVNKQLAIFIAIIYIFLILKNIDFPNRCAYDTNNKNISFYWWTNKNGYLYVITSLLLLILLLTYKFRFFQISLFIISYLISKLISKNNHGSIWCWIAAFIPLINFIYFKYYLMM